MKRLALSLLLAGTFASTADAAGNTGTINFIGVLTATTCDYTLANSAGAAVPAIDLGTASITSFTRGSDVTFQLMPDQTNPSCKHPMSTGTPPAAQNIVFEVVPSALDANGVVNATGTATGAGIELSVKDKTGFVKLNSASPRVSDVDIDATTGAIPLKAAMVKAGSATVTAGTVAGGAIFAVTYK